MDQSKLHEIIKNKNDRLEEQALRTAADIIDDIADQQQIITAANERISELRQRLTALEISQLDATAILG